MQPQQRSPAAGAQQQLFAAGDTAALAAAGESAEKGAVCKGLVQKGGLGLSAMWQLSSPCCCSDEGHDECDLGRCFCHITPGAAVLLETFSHAAARAGDGCGKGRQADAGACAPTALVWSSSS